MAESCPQITTISIFLRENYVAENDGDSRYGTKSGSTAHGNDKNDINQQQMYLNQSNITPFLCKQSDNTTESLGMLSNHSNFNTLPRNFLEL